MSKLSDVVRPLRFDDGQTRRIGVSPDVEIAEALGQRGGKVFIIPIRGPNGKDAIIQGGGRLLDTLQALNLPPGKETKVDLTAHGQAGEMSRWWEAKVVK